MCNLPEGTHVPRACDRWAGQFPPSRVSDKDKISFWSSFWCLLHWSVSISQRCSEAWGTCQLFSFLLFTEQVANKVRKKSCDHLQSFLFLFFSNLLVPRWFLGVKSNLVGSSEGSGQVVRGGLVDSGSSASRAGSAAPLLPSVVVPGRGLARPGWTEAWWTCQARLGFSKLWRSCGTFRPPAARHSTLAICWQVHISHCGELKWWNRQKKSFICSSLRLPRLWFGIKHLLHDLLQGQFLSSNKGYDFRQAVLPLAGGNLPGDLI